MRTLILLGALIVSTAAMVPDTWKVTLNNKALLVTSVENPEKNKFTISRAELLKKGPLVISYTEKKPEKGWKREISVVDPGENDLVKRGNSKVTITTGELKKILDKGVKTIHVYSWTLPTDPNKAAVVRVRRVHLCTIIVS
jgi:hypothetical protein